MHPCKVIWHSAWHSCVIVTYVYYHMAHCVWGASDRLYGMEGSWVVLGPHTVDVKWKYVNVIGINCDGERTEIT